MATKATQQAKIDQGDPQKGTNQPTPTRTDGMLSAFMNRSHPPSNLSHALSPALLAVARAHLQSPAMVSNRRADLGFHLCLDTEANWTKRRDDVFHVLFLFRPE